MKKLLFIAAVIPFIAAVATDEPQKDPAAESAEKSARVQAMADAFRPSVVNIRFRLKRLPDGSRPNASMPYRCPACNNSRCHISDSDEKDIPNLVAGFVLDKNRVLVQDLYLRRDWIDRLEVVCGTNAVPARPTLCYPNENAVLLETERPIPWWRTSTDASRPGCARSTAISSTTPRPARTGARQRPTPSSSTRRTGPYRCRCAWTVRSPASFPRRRRAGAASRSTPARRASRHSRSDCCRPSFPSTSTSTRRRRAIRAGCSSRPTMTTPGPATWTPSALRLQTARC